VRFEVLGPLRAWHGERDVTPSGHLQRRLLGVLLLHANRVVPADVLVDALWGENGETGRLPNLHLHVHRLRRVLGDADRLASLPDGYQLSVMPGELDAERFESLIDEASEWVSRDPRRCTALIREALQTWRGSPLGGLDVPLLIDEARRLGERRLVAIEDLYTAELACGRHNVVADEVPGLVREHPLRERFHGLLMVALHRGGRQASALAAYRAARRVLVEELGQEPGPELRRIEQLILAGEPVDLGPAAAANAPVPGQLPHDVRGFSGRDAELRALDDMLDAGGPVLISAVAGTGGVGKTALAVHWAHRMRDRFPDGQLYADLRGYGPQPPMPPEDALARFLRELGVDGAAIPAGLDERAAMFRSLVAERRMLILLDNARSADQVRPLLPGGSRCVVLVTSRDALAGLVARDGAHRLVVDRLSHADAWCLLQDLVGRDRVDADPGATDVLIERCARLPLALRIAAELVNSRPGLGVGDLADELTDERSTLDLLDAGSGPETAVRAVFSWSYRWLSQEAARLFRLLGVHPGCDIDSYALAALAGCRPPEVRRLAEVLTRAHLVDETAPGRYQTHDLLRAYAADLAAHADTGEAREAALDRLYGHFLSAARIAALALRPEMPVPLPAPPEVDTAVPALADPDEAAAWLDAERANLVDVARYAAAHGRPYAAMHLAAMVFYYFQANGHHDEALAIHHAALTAACEQNDVLEQGNAHRYLGTVHYRCGRFDLAWDHMLRSHRCYQRCGDVRFIRLQLLNLGVVCTIARSNYPDAIAYLTEALRLYEDGDSGGDSGDRRNGHVLTLIYLGRLHLILRRHDEALRYLTEVLDIAGPDELPIEFFVNLGVAHSRLGHYDEARCHLERARHAAREAHNPGEEAGIFPLGQVYWELGRRDDAFRCVEHCLDTTRRLRDTLREPSVLNALGTLHLSNGTHTEALGHYRNALDIAEAIGKRHTQARAHDGIGDASNALGDLTTARTHWGHALEIYRDLATSEADAVRAKLDAC
jgi:DNA-binding SARP family transcriptional activator/tetratricopeptide (TPR) repeat protein